MKDILKVPMWRLGKVLNIYGLYHSDMATYNGIYIVSDNGLLPDGTQPFAKPMLTNH